MDGGLSGRKRSLGKINKKDESTPITPSDIVCDKFYFLLFTPIDHSEAILIVQGYTSLKISDVLREHLKDFFSHGRDIKSKVEIFVPSFLKDEYLEGSTFNSASFSTGWIVNGHDFDVPEQKSYDLQVKIEIVDRSKEKSNYEDTAKIIEWFKQFKLSVGNTSKRTKNLGEFPKQNAKIKSNGRPIPIQFDNNNEITPVIILKDQGIEVNPETNELNFEEIDSYCNDLLNKILEEHLPSNAIKEL